MGYNGKLPGKDEVASLIIDALRKDKKDVVINAEVKAEVNQASFDKAKKQIDSLDKEIDVDINTSKAEKRLENLLEALTEMQQKIKSTSQTDIDFQGLHNIIKQYELLKKEIYDVAQVVGQSNNAFKESKKIISDTESVLRKLGVTEKKTAANKKTSKKKKGSTVEVDTATTNYEHQADAVKDVVKATEDLVNITEQAADAQKQQINLINKQRQATEELAKSQLKLTKKKNGSGKVIPQTYTAVNGKYYIEKGSTGWNVYDESNKGMRELIASYETLNELRRDGVLIAEQESAALLKQKDATKKVVAVQQQLNQILKKNIGYHAGDLGKSEHYGQFAYGRRDTGHFGTGTYLVGDPSQIQGYNKRNGVAAPWNAVDLSKYVLFKPENTDRALELHAVLKQINDDLLFMHKYDNIDLSFLQQAINAGNMEPISKFIKTYLSENEYDKYRDEALYYKDYLEQSNADNIRAEIEKIHYDIGKEIKGFDGIDDIWLIDEELIEEEVQRKLSENKSALKNFNLEAEIAKRVAYDMEHGMFATIGEMQELKTNLTDRLANIFFGVSKDMLARMLENTFKTISQYPESEYYNKDNASTVFMKQLGYEGIDTRHTGLDNTAYGTVIYDLKEESVILRGITDEKERQLLLEGKIDDIVSARNIQEQAKLSKEAAAATEAQAKAEEKLASAAEKTAEAKKEQETYTSLLSGKTVKQLTKGVDLNSLLTQFRVPTENRAAIQAEFSQLVDAIYDILINENGSEDAYNLMMEKQSTIEKMIADAGKIKEDRAQLYDDFRNYMKGIQIYYDDSYKSEFGDDWKDIIKRFGSGKHKVLTKDPRALGADQLYQDLLENFSGLLDTTKINEKDQLKEILNVLQRARDESKSKYSGLTDEAIRAVHESVSEMIGIISSNTINILSGSSSPNVSVEEIIKRDLEGALEQLRSASNNETVLFNLKGVLDGEDLITQAQEMIKNIAEQANLSLGKFSVTDDTIKVQLYNEELKVTVDQMYKLKAATEEMESSQLQLVGQSFSQNVKALNANNFDIEGVQQRALAAIAKVKSSLHGLEYDLTDLEAAAKSIASQDDFTKFNNQLKAAQDNIQAIKNSTVSKNSMNPLANMQRDMQNANIEIETMRLKLEKFGNIQGVAEAKQMLTEMAEAAKQYNSATDAQGQQSAYNQYSNLRSSFKAQTEYINAAKTLHDSQQSEEKRTNPIKEQYQEILNLVNKINTANERMIKFQQMDKGSGLAAGKIAEEQQKKLEAVQKLQSVLNNLDVGSVLGKDAYTLPEDIQSIGTDYSQISAFINDAGVQASLTTAEIEKLVAALVKAGDIDLSMLSEILGNESIIARAKQVAYENKYFSDKTTYSSDLKAEDIQKLGSVSDETKAKLEEMAQSVAKNSEGAVVLAKNFSVGADGIARLDFSIFDTNTGSIENFTAALGTATGQMGIFKTTVDKLAKTKESALNQIAKSQQSLASFGFGDIGLNDTTAPAQVTQILSKVQELRRAMEIGDQSGIAQYTKELDLLTKGFEKASNQAYKMKEAIENGTAVSAGTINPNGDIYGQLIRTAQEYAATQDNVTLQLGAFDSTTNTLNASLVRANGTVEQLKFTMYGLGGEVAQQQVGMGKLTTSWDRFKTTIAGAGKRLMTALVGYNVFYKAISEVRKGIGYVKEIDLAMTELKKVTDETKESYDRFLDSAASRAGEIGSTVSDFTEATSNFARLGYTMEESADMAETAIVYKNVADGLDTVEEATESIISTMKAFGIESNDTMGIIDRFNEVGNNFAITSAGIGEALQRSASALYAGGNTIDESIALVTAANSVIQNPEQVGTALKTLTLRLRGAKVELEEAGLETENMAESTSTLQAKLKALTHGKVDIMTDADTFKNTTQILREMSAAWEDMTDIERAASLELMGGKRQANILSSLISNFETVEDVIETSMNSSGSALTENEKYMDSIAGKSEKLTNAMQAMWNNTINSDVIKYFLELELTITNAISAFGPWKSVLVGTLVYLKAFKNIGLISVAKDFAAGITNYASAMQQVQHIKSLNLGFTATGALNTESVLAYSNALAGLSAKQQAAILSSAGLEKAHIAQVLAQNGVEDATIRQIVGLNSLNAAKQSSVAVTGQEIAATLSKQGVTLSDATTTWLADNATKQLTKDEVLKAAAMLMSKGATEQEIAALLQLAGASVTATGGIKGVTSALWSMMASNPVGWILTAISAIVMITTAVSQANDEAVQAAEETISKYKEEQKTLRENKETLDELADSYERLSKGVDLNTNENVNLTTASYEEYLDVCNEIAEMYPNLVMGFDAQGNAILSVKGNVDLLTQSYKDAAAAARQTAILEGGDVFDVFKDKYSGTDWNPWGGENADFSDQLALGEALLQVISSGSSSDIETFFDGLWGAGKYATHSDFNDLHLMESFLSNANIDGGDFGFSSFTLGSGVDGEEVKKYQAQIIAYVKQLRQSINAETNKVTTLMSAYLGEDLTYASYSDDVRELIDQIVAGLDAQFINKFDSAGELYAWIQENIVDAFQDQSVVDAVNNLSDLQLKFSFGGMTLWDYKQEVNALVSEIQNKVDEDALIRIKASLNIDDPTLQANIAHIQSMLDPEQYSWVYYNLTAEDIKIGGQLEVPEGTILSWNELIDKIDEAKITATGDFNIANLTNEISAHSAAITEYQEALQKLDKGSFTMDDFMELIEKYPELAEGVDLSSNAFHGLANNLNGAIKSSTKNFIRQLKEMREKLVAAGKSTTELDKFIDNIENMSTNALDSMIQKYSTLANKIKEAQINQNKLAESMEENPNAGYETRGEAMEYMKEAMKKGEIGSESNLWNVAEQYGFTYDSAKSVNENADALAKFIAIREKWFKEADDGDGSTNDGYSYEGTENFIKAVEAAVQSNEELQNLLKWDYDENTGTLNYEYNNEFWDEIVTMLSETQELAGLTSDEFADMMLQIGQYFGINWGDYDDILSHLNKIANGSEDAKTKVEEYGRAIQNYFGESSDVDLSARPMVRGTEMQKAGWTDFDGEYATVYSSTFSTKDGAKSIVVTPILPDGTVLSPEKLAEYANKLLAGEHIDADVDITLAEFDGTDSVKKANDYAQALHKAQEEYDVLRDTLGLNSILNNEGIEGLKEIEEIQDTINTKSDGTTVIDEEAFRDALESAQYTEDQIDLIIDKIKTLNEDAFNIDPLKIDETLTKKGTAGLLEIEELKEALKHDPTTGITIFDTDLFTDVLEGAEYTKEQIDGLIKQIKKYNNILAVSGNTDPLGLKSAGLSVDSLKSSLLALGVDVLDEEWWFFGDHRSLTINVTDMVTALKEKGWTDEAIKSYVNELANKTEIDGVGIEIEGIENIDDAIEAANQMPETKTTAYEVTGTGLKSLEDADKLWDEVTKDKTTNYTINETTVKKTKQADSSGTVWWNPFTWFANGTAHAKGTAFSGGSWGAPRTETALTGELGPEILVRGNKWTTVGENGAEFTDVRKGDIIFNHKQSEQLLKNGYVTSRGKAYAGGTAYAQTNTTFAKYGFSGNGGYTKYDLNNAITDTYGDLSKSMSDASDSASEFAETFDWVAVRIEEITDDIDLNQAKLDNAVGYKAQNKLVDQIISDSQTLRSNLLSGANAYYAKANTYLAKIPAEYREAAKDGSIALTEFAGEVGEETYNAIEEYRDWVQKGDDLTQQAEETLTEIENLAKQAIDNIAQTYENKSSVNDSKQDQYDAYNEYVKTTTGFESEQVYRAQIATNNKDIATKTTQRDKMQEELDKRVKSGEITKYSQAWYDAVNAIAAVDTEIINLQTDNKNLQDSINELHWDRFDLLMDKYDAVSQEAENMIELLSNEDMVDDSGNWTDAGITSLGLYAQQMEQAAIKSREYGKQITYLDNNWQELGYTEQEYLDKRQELADAQQKEIKTYQDSKDAIVDLNKERVNAIKDGIQKEIDAYDELIEKKKEELDAEQDLYDFQKKSQEHSKNIADIERKLAALAGDNSASAVAQRKKLEAELAEAKAAQEDFYYQRSVENKKNALDEEKESFTENKNSEIEQWEEYLKDPDGVVKDSIDAVQANAATVLDTINQTAQEYGITLSETLTDPWKQGAQAIQDYNGAFDKTPTSATAQELADIKSDHQSKMQEIKEQGKNLVNQVNDNFTGYTQATKQPPKTNTPNTNTPTKTTPTTPTSKTITKGGKINATGAKIYGTKGAKTGSSQYYSSDPIYKVLDIDGNWLKVRYHKLSSGVSGWFKKSDVKAYAKGSLGVKKNQLALIDELGEELQLIPGQNGRLEYVKKGTGIIPADLTERLMDLAMNPQDVLDRNRPQINPSKSVMNNNTELSIDASVGTLLHVEHLDGSNPDEVMKIVNKAWEKKMQGLNNSIKKFSR